MKYATQICLSLALAMPLVVSAKASSLANSPLNCVLNRGAENGAGDMKNLLALAVTCQAQAQYLIGARYQEGDGVIQGFSKVAIWCRKAAEQNYPNALYNLGHYYYSGKGVNRDFKAAKYLFEKAASAGNDKAPGNLGVMYMIGEGVSRDLVEAFKLATIGIANGDRRAAEFRRDIAGHLTDNQISAGGVRARLWFYRHARK
ncbi:MAG: tetratricopeptide repeat protein [Alphaproteobacteria bacterium]